MSWGEVFDPTGNNYLGAGKTWGRVLGDMPFIGTWGLGEFARPNSFGMNRDTNAAGAIRGIGQGGASGAGSGMMVGGPYGALAGGIAGGAAGGIMGGLGKTDPSYKPAGFMENVGIGGGAGALGAWGAGAMGGSAAGGAGGSGAGAMTPYMPTSTPVMGQAGSTLGGGMGSSMNLAPAYGSATGAAAGPMAAPASGGSSQLISRLLKMYRPGQQSGGEAPASGQPNTLEMLYKMFPSLRPGQALGQGMRTGAMYG